VRVAATVRETNRVPTSRALAGASSESPTGGSSSPLVGTWTRTISCNELLKAELDAHLEMLAYESIVGGEFVSGDPNELARMKTPVKARSVEHSHFFTEDGKFGSRRERPGSMTGRTS
jgi:hypothetical protein